MQFNKFNNMNKKFKKKPVIIEAIQFNGTNLNEIVTFTNNNAYSVNIDGSNELNHIYIRTLEGDMKAIKGDWIICGVKGEFYPCKSDIFEQTYDAV